MTAGRQNRPMQGSVVEFRLAAVVLHYVELARLRPPDLKDVGTNNPERRPHPQASRNLGTDLESSIGLAEVVARVEPSRRYYAVAIPALIPTGILVARHDDQVALTVKGGIGCATGVVLELAVTPARSPGLVIPLRRVRRRSGRPIELVRPGKRPARGVRRRRGYRGHRLREAGGRQRAKQEKGRQ